MNKGDKRAVIVGGLVLALFVVLAVVLHAFAYFCAGRGWGIIGPRMMYGFGGGWFMGILMLAVVGLFIWGLIALVQRGGTTHGCCSANASALDILKERYAKGEINQEQFEQIKKDLL